MTLIDSLAYIDKEYEEIRETVENLIREEMKLMDKKDYLNKYPTFDNLLDKHPLLKAELDRVEAKQPMTKLDLSVYNIKEPTGKSVAAWEKALDRAMAQEEHLHTRLLNLELMKQFGADVWKLKNAQLEGIIKQYKAKTEANKQAISEINKKRKAEQIEVGKELAKMEEKWIESVNTKLQLEHEIQRLEEGL
jgi:pre-mRNA-splicing factor SPF27